MKAGELLKEEQKLRVIGREGGGVITCSNGIRKTKEIVGVRIKREGHKKKRGKLWNMKLKGPKEF